MGGERASTSRRRLAGEICALCHVTLPGPPPGREALCPACAEKKNTRAVYMKFERCMGWRITFQDTADPRARFIELTFADQEKIEELARKTCTRMSLETVQAMELAFSRGRGAMCLLLTPEQYRKIVRQHDK